MRAAPVCALALVFLAVPTAQTLRAEEPPREAAPTDENCSSPPRWCLSVGERNWISFGASSFSLSGLGGHPNVVSELNWPNLQSTVTEINLDAVYDNRFVAHADVGLGWFYSGRLRDADYFGENRTGLFSLSDSLLDTGSIGVLSLIGDCGYRVYRSEKFTLDALVGYQFWREKYHAVGGTLYIPTLVPFQPIPLPRVPVDQENYTHECFRVGGRSHWQFLPRLSLDTRLMLVPWGFSEVTDFHFQRPDLARPSFQARTDGGFGVMLDSVVTYRVWRGLSVMAGYQLWDMTSGHGGVNEFFQGGFNLNLHLNEIDTIRHGAIVGAVYRF